MAPTEAFALCPSRVVVEATGGMVGWFDALKGIKFPGEWSPGRRANHTEPISGHARFFPIPLCLPLCPVALRHLHQATHVI